MMIFTSILILIFFFPFITFAAPADFAGFVTLILDLISVTIPVVMGLAVLFFAIGLAKFILKAGDAKSHADGKQFMIWSIIALFAMVSIYGLIIFAKNQFEFGGGIGFPLLPTSNR